jgi:hypothetical protein
MDWIAFYWSMLLSVLGSIGLAVRYMIQELEEKAAQEASSAKGAEKDSESKAQKPQRPALTASQDVSVEMPTTDATTKVRKRKIRRSTSRMNLNDESDEILYHREN